MNEKYTDEQKFVIEILKPIKDLLKQERIKVAQLVNTIDDIERKYGLKPKYLTLREYLVKNSIGAYHHFIFEIRLVKIDVIGVEDFEDVYKGELLDKYYVVDDKEKSFGSNCENYQCNHYLKLEEIEIEKNE